MIVIAHQISGTDGATCSCWQEVSQYTV